MTSVALLGPAMLAASLLAASLQGPAPAGSTALATQQRAAARLLGQLDAPRRTAHVVAQLPDLEATLDVYGRPASLRDDEPDRAPGISEPVVKVYTVHCSPNLHMPWTNKPQEESSGSGFTIETDGRRCILTNAHVVADATYLEVRKAGDARKYVARRLKVCHDCDLATLVVDDDAFWAGVSPLELGPMPSLQDEVSVVGYPEGGEGVSITQGVVSRIEIQR